MNWYTVSIWSHDTFLIQYYSILVFPSIMTLSPKQAKRQLEVEETPLSETIEECNTEDLMDCGFEDDFDEVPSLSEVTYVYDWFINANSFKMCLTSQLLKIVLIASFSKTVLTVLYLTYLVGCIIFTLFEIQHLVVPRSCVPIRKNYSEITKCLQQCTVFCFSCE